MRKMIATKNVNETYKLSGDLIEKVIKGKELRKKAIVIALYGQLGSGKTSFAQGAAQALGVKETVVSPTFIIERVYRIAVRGFTHFIHIDCYRLSGVEELKKLGWEEIVQNSRNIIFIEWAEKVENILPKNAIKVYFEIVNENTREISISSP